MIATRSPFQFASRLVLACATFSTILVGTRAHAVPVTFIFGGRVTNTGPFVQAPWNTVNVNDPFSLTYTFEDTSADTQPADPGVGSTPRSPATLSRSGA